MKEIKNKYTRSGKSPVFISRNLNKRRRKQELLSRVKNPADHLKIFLNGEKLNLKGNPSNYLKHDLFTAFHANDIATFESLLANGAGVNSATEEGYSILMLAADYGRIEILNLLVASPSIDINKRDKWKYTALIRAAQSGQVNSVEMLLTAPNIDVHAVDIYGKNALSYAISGGHANANNIEQALLKAGASKLEAQTTISLTPQRNPNPVIFSQPPTVVANNPPVALPLTLSMPSSIVPPNGAKANSENNADPAVEEVNNQLHTLRIKH